MCIRDSQKLLYDALYHAASATLNELSKDAKYLGADIGYICILHTWGSAMNYHPHIHTIVLGGGLDDENKWKETGGNFFLPYGVISKVLDVYKRQVLFGVSKKIKVTALYVTKVIYSVVIFML